MTDSSTYTPLVSVIVPVYNAEPFLSRCMNSILAQSMEDLELIVVNDGSTDSSLQILHEYEMHDARVIVIDQENAGQGAARNLALSRARGEYVLFVDADDFIERVTLQVTTDRAIEDSSDLVHFDWKLYTPNVGRPGDVHYYNVDPFWHKRVLLGVECDELLRVQNFYSVTKLYRRSFLEEYDIRFEEGRIYEDNPFVLQVVNRAQTASLVHSPLYIIDPHPDSSTRSHTDSDKHARDHLHAVRRTFELLDRRNPRAAAYLAAYHVKKIGPYYERRIPRRLRRAYVKEFVDILHQANVEVPPGTSTNAPMRLAMRLRLFERRRSGAFQAMVGGKNLVMPRYKRLKSWAKKTRNRRSRTNPWSEALEDALAQPVLAGTISFLGLDFKYAGNSKYLFEELVADPRFEGRSIKFVTKDTTLDAKYRLQPGLIETNEVLARSQIVIAESWIPPRVRKHSEAIWIQLWHGTPIKRMLFDSHERRIIWNRRHHKTNKYRDILNWDYLVADSPVAAEKFMTSFLVKPSQIILSGYPRVKHLVAAEADWSSRAETRATLGIPAATAKRVILYAPTWRDYNYSKAPRESDYSYFLDLYEFAEQLGEDYLVLFHDHGYLAASAGRKHVQVVDASANDIQDLLLVSDFVVSDYSSVVFDAMAIDRPIFLYAPDLSKYEAHRGIYPDVWSDLQPCVSTTIDGLVAAICQGGQTEQSNARGLAERYTFTPQQDLAEFLIELRQRDSASADARR